MIEQELQQKLIEVSSELNIARQNMAQIKKSLVQAESIIIDLKLLQERLTEELYALSESTPVKEKTEYNDLSQSFKKRRDHGMKDGERNFYTFSTP